MIKESLIHWEKKSIEDSSIFNLINSKLNKSDSMKFSLIVLCFQTLLETKSLKSGWNQLRKLTKKAEKSSNKDNTSTLFTSSFQAVSKSNTTTFTSSEVSATSSTLTTSRTTSHPSAPSEPKPSPKSWKSKLTSLTNFWNPNPSSNLSGTKASSCTQSDTRRVCKCWKNTSQRKSWEGLWSQLKWNWWRKETQISCSTEGTCLKEKWWVTATGTRKSSSYHRKRRSKQWMMLCCWNSKLSQELNLKIKTEFLSLTNDLFRI